MTAVFLPFLSENWNKNYQKYYFSTSTVCLAKCHKKYIIKKSIFNLTYKHFENTSDVFQFLGILKWMVGYWKISGGFPKKLFKRFYSSRGFLGTIVQIKKYLNGAWHFK